MTSGPAASPPRETFEYCCPSDCAARSVHCSCGASRFRLMPRVMKFDPGLERRVSCPPLKPPRETSYGDVTSDVDTPASRGRLEPPNAMPFSVVLFWSAPSPRTEKPFGSPFCPG